MKFSYRISHQLGDDKENVFDWLTDNIGDVIDYTYYHESDVGSDPNLDFETLYIEYVNQKNELKTTYWSKQYVKTVVKTLGQGWQVLTALHFLGIHDWVEDTIIQIDNDTLAIQFKLAFL
jgi:hypothetical protein